MKQFSGLIEIRGNHQRKVAFSGRVGSKLDDRPARRTGTTADHRKGKVLTVCIRAGHLKYFNNIKSINNRAETVHLVFNVMFIFTSVLNLH